MSRQATTADLQLMDKGVIRMREQDCSRRLKPMPPSISMHDERAFIGTDICSLQRLFLYEHLHAKDLPTLIFSLAIAAFFFANIDTVVTVARQPQVFILASAPL